jgi:hypothetical protein
MPAHPAPCATLEPTLQPTARESSTVTAIILTMLLVLVAAAGVVAYVAYPHRGADIPGAPWLGDAMRKGVERLPTLDDDQHADHYRV